MNDNSKAPPVISQEQKGRRGLLAPSTKENLKRSIYKFVQNKISIIGLLIVLVTFFCALFAKQIIPFPGHVESFTDFANASQAPSALHWFGTDIYGRDLFSRCIYAFRGAMYMSVVVLALSVPLGVLLGLIAGYKRGTWVDAVIMRSTDIFLSLPPIVLALAIAAILSPTMMNSMIAITLTWWPWYTRLVYGQAATVSNEYFVKNAELIGASRLHIVLSEILPNCLSPILTKMALDVGWVILLGATLSFVGLGEQPPIPAFGQMISESIKYIPEYWWLTLFPSFCIAFIILGFNLFGDGLRDMFDRGR